MQRLCFLPCVALMVPGLDFCHIRVPRCFIQWLFVIPHVSLLLTGMDLHHPGFPNVTHLCGSASSQVSKIGSLGGCGVYIVPSVLLPLTGLLFHFLRCPTGFYFCGFMSDRCSIAPHKVMLCPLRFPLAPKSFSVVSVAKAGQQRGFVSSSVSFSCSLVSFRTIPGVTLLLS